MDTHLTFPEHLNQFINKPRAVEAQLAILTRMHGIVPERVRVDQIACVQAVELYGSEHWWDPKDTGR